MSIDLIAMEPAGAPCRATRPAGTADRRGAPRFDAVEDRIWLGWWDGEQFRTIGARLLDISRTGAAIACPEGPDRGDDAWFCVVGPGVSGGARARVDSPTVRCAMPLRAQPGLLRQARLYDALEELHANHLGVYASVVAGGRVVVGDPVQPPAAVP